MSGIERANPDTLSGVFYSFDDANWTDKGKLSDERLKNLVEHMSKIKVGNENYAALKNSPTIAGIRRRSFTPIERSST